MKRILAFILCTIMLIMMVQTTAFAATYHKKIECCSYYRIKHVESGKYLDVNSGYLYDNGTQLQIWERSGQNQVFFIYDTGAGWIIESHTSGKIIEVRNSSHDAYAQVAQWDDCGQKCGRWNIIYNKDGTISFKNCESGLYMNVYGNYTENGSKLIQYPYDGTTAAKFVLEQLTGKDVLNAKWTWNGGISKLRYEYITSIEYMDPSTVGYMILASAQKPSFFDDVKSILLGEGTEDLVNAVFNAIELKNVPCIGYALGLFQSIIEMENNKEWNKFIRYVSFDKEGKCTGIIKYTYKNYYTGKRRTEYGIWNGNNFTEVQYEPQNQKGYWTYNFK